MKKITSLLASLWLCINIGHVIAEQVHLAVASNFAAPAAQLAQLFEQRSGHAVIVSPGATGKHYAQITHGAPYDVFMAADVVRPLKLEAEGHAVVGTRFTYAFGKLVLWSPRVGYVDNKGSVLANGNFRHLALANPRLAPYGMAARDVLESRRLWETVQAKLVQGENIAQTYQYVASGNAELGFVAYSQLVRPNQPVSGSLWEVPSDMYAPIEQQAVLIHDTPAARAFLNYVRGSEATRVIRQYGYETP
jgi:molybdate transport system substrate-binding protein